MSYTNEDVRKRGNKWCAYVDDKLTKAEKERNPKKYKGKKVGSVQKTPSGKIRMKARACYSSKKKANNAMAAAMMEGERNLRELIRETILEGLVDIPRLVRDANGLMDQADAQLPSDRFDAFYNEITFLIDELESGSATPAEAQQFKRSIEDIADRYGIKSSESSRSYNTSAILSKWVGDSQTVNAAERKHLAGIVAGSKLSLGSIERVMPDPKLEVGEVIDWTGDVVSFSKLRFSRGASVYQFHARKGSCILQIVRPTRGLVIDYDSVEHTFGRRGENEVLITGKYQVVSEETANEVPVYVIEEI